MNIFKQLEKEHSKENSLRIISYIGNDSGLFHELMDCFFAETDNYKVPQRAAHTVSLMFDRNQQIVLSYMDRLIISVLNPELASPLKRNILRILQSMEIPENFLGEIYEACYGFLINPKEEIAIRAFAITVLYNI